MITDQETKPVEIGDRKVRYSRLRNVWRAPLSLKNIKYTRMRYFKKNSKIFSPEGPRKNVSTGPAVALDESAENMALAVLSWQNNLS